MLRGIGGVAVSNVLSFPPKAVVEAYLRTTGHALTLEECQVLRSLDWSLLLDRSGRLNWLTVHNFARAIVSNRPEATADETAAG